MVLATRARTRGGGTRARFLTLPSQLDLTTELEFGILLFSLVMSSIMNRLSDPPSGQALCSRLKSNKTRFENGIWSFGMPPSKAASLFWRVTDLDHYSWCLALVVFPYFVKCIEHLLVYCFFLK